MSKINPLYSIAILLFSIFISLFFGISKKHGIKIFIIILSAVSLILAFAVNIYIYAAQGNFSSFLFTFEALQMVEICVVVFSAINILIFISINHIKRDYFNKLLIMFLFAVCASIFFIVSSNFIMIFLSLAVFTISAFQLITSLNRNS